MPWVMAYHPAKQVEGFASCDDDDNGGGGGDDDGDGDDMHI